MAVRALLVLAVAMAAVLGTAQGASYTVGAPAGSWDLQTNYTRWASGINFRAGDQLVFKYSPGAHNVLEVSKADHDSCSVSSPLTTFATGDDTVPLPAGGVTRYFICGVPGHCAGGMKLAVRVEATAAAAPSPTPVAMAPRRAAAPRPSTAAPTPAPVAMAPPTAAPTPAPVAMPPRAARPPMATPGAEAPSTGGLAAVPPSTSAAAPGGIGSLVGLGLAAAVAALVALY